MEPQVEVPQPSKPFPLLPALLSFLVLLLLLSTAFLAYQNMQLQKQIIILQTQTTPTPPTSLTPTPTCRPRPACLDATPRCMIPETSDMCPYSCPVNGWVDCMPILTPEKQVACSVEAMAWYKANCPNFKGGAL